MDWGLKMVAAVLLVAAGGLAGHATAAAMRRRVQVLSGLLPALAALKHQMLELRTPLPDALRNAGHPAFAQVGEALREKPGATPGDCWRAVDERLRAQGGAFDCLTVGDAEVLGQLFEGLGAGGAQAQSILLSEAALALTEAAEAAKKQRDEKGKLYTSLGVLGGMALAILWM